MVLLWILLGLIAALAILVCVPVSLSVVWNGGDPEVKVRYLFISYIIYPSEKNKPRPGTLRAYISDLLTELKKKKTDKPRPAEPQPQQPKKSAWQSLCEQRGFWGAIGYLLRIVAASAQLAAYVLRRSVVSRMKLSVAIGGDDAAAIAITQGQWCAAVYPAVSLVLCSVRRYRGCSVNIVPDFLSAENRYDVDIRLRVMPVWGIIGALKMLVSLARDEVSGQTGLSAEALRAAGERRPE